MTNIILEKNTDPKVAGEFLAERIIEQLNQNKKVLWFATGGSSILVASIASEIISKVPHANLTVMLTDERYGAPNHPDSNWLQLMEKGFKLPDAKVMPILNGESIEDTVKKFDEELKEQLSLAEYKIGLFGVGPDGHTAGMIPGFRAVESKDFAFGYTAGKYERVTMTTVAIKKLDEAVVYMQGENKWHVVYDLLNNDLPLLEQPTQILKSVPKVTILSDYNI